MTALPSVEPLPPGTRPTEPGWYVVRDCDGSVIVEVAYDDFAPSVLRVYGDAQTQGLPVAVWQEHARTFIARIYPDRIGQE